MKLAPQYEFNPDQERILHKARLIEYVTLAYIVSVIWLMYLVMGSSQAMKTAWIEDCLSLVPPLCFLVASHLCWRKPTPRYPYGFHRVVSILFLCAALALLLAGAYLLVEAVLKLVRREHPAIGMQDYFGIDMWLGWWMILVLLWGTLPPVLLGHWKVKNAGALNDKILSTDGLMNKADWMTAVAAILGVLGIGLGWWWSDAVAAIFISLDIVKDGWSHSADAVTGLMNRAPTSLDGNYLHLPEEVSECLEKNPSVERAQVRMYEHGHLFFGEAFIHPRDNQPVTSDFLDELGKQVSAIDWRIKSFLITLQNDTGEDPTDGKDAPDIQQDSGLHQILRQTKPSHDTDTR